MNTEEQRRPPFFGRQREIQELRRRIQEPGLTVVKGRPRIGKSRLLEELVSRLRAEAEQQPVAKRLLVGWLREPGAEGNALLRAVADAYDHWLKSASARKQLKFLWKKNKDSAVLRAGTAIGKIMGAWVSDAGKVIPGAKTVGATITEVFGAFRQLGDELRTGGLQISPLQADEARSLLWFLAEGRGHPVVLVLNQWEDSLLLDHDFITLKTFLRNIHDWPSVHVLLHLRCPLWPENVNLDAVRKADDLVRASPCAESVDVLPIDFIGDNATRNELLDWLKKGFPGMKEMPEESLLSDTIAGNPAVLDEWVNMNDLGKADPAALRKKAQNAHDYLYPEIEHFLLGLVDRADQCDDNSRRILEAALNLAVIPPPGSNEAWEAVKGAVLGEADEAMLTALFESRDYLRHSSDAVPSFGHSTRQEAARRLALENERLKPYARRALERLTGKLVDDSDVPAAITGVGPDSAIRLSLLIPLIVPLILLEAKPINLRLAGAAGALSGLPWAPEKTTLAKADFEIRSAQRARLLAMGLVNAIYRAGSNAERADALLDILRTLYEAHSDDAAVRELFAKGLFNAFNNAGSDAERAESLLRELRRLHDSHPEDPVIREAFERLSTSK